MTAAASLVVRGYRTLVSPLFPARCKYHPTCSQYALDALREYGLVRGIVLAAWRLLRCNPLSDGGVDHARDQKIFVAAPSRFHRVDRSFQTAPRDKPEGPDNDIDKRCLGRSRCSS